MFCVSIGILLNPFNYIELTEQPNTVHTSALTFQFFFNINEYNGQKNTSIDHWISRFTDVSTVGQTCLNGKEIYFILHGLVIRSWMY